MIGIYLGFFKDEFFGICVLRCINDIRCNVIDICFENLKCKLIRGWIFFILGSIFEGVC